MAESSSYNDGTDQHRQMVRVRQASRKVYERNQCCYVPQEHHQLEPDGYGLGATHGRSIGRLPEPGCSPRQGGHAEDLRCRRGDVAGAKLGTDPDERLQRERGNHPEGSVLGQRPAGWKGRPVAG